MSDSNFWQNYISEFKNSSAGFYSFGAPEDLSSTWQKTCRDVFEKDKVNITSLVYDTFGIDSSRQVLSLINSSSDKKIEAIGIFSNTWTHDAQNVLLKALEDIPERKILCLGSNDPHNFINTLRSRLFFIPHALELNSNFCKNFLEAQVSERLKIVKEIIGNKSKDGLDNSENDYVLKNMRDLTVGLLPQINLQQSGNNISVGVINTAIELLSVPSPSIRAIAEYLAIALPTRE